MYHYFSLVILSTAAIYNYFEGWSALLSCHAMTQVLPMSLSRAASEERRKRIAETYRHQDLKARKIYEDDISRHPLTALDGPRHCVQKKGTTRYLLAVVQGPRLFQDRLLGQAHYFRAA